MKTTALFLALATSARALTITSQQMEVGTTYTENGLTFTSPSPISIVSGNWGATLFGYGGIFPGHGLSVDNHGWLGISAGADLDSLTFMWGADWNFYSIEYGLMDLSLEWVATSQGATVGNGALHFTREHRSHGGFFVTADPDAAFDTLLVRATAVQYYGVPWPVGVPNPVGWFYDRGAVVGWGDANHIAVANVSAVLEPVPQMQFAMNSLPAIPSAHEGGSTALLLLASLLALVGARRWL